MNPTMAGQTIDRVECEVSLDIYSREGGKLRIESEYTLERPLEPTLSSVEGQEGEVLTVLTGLVGTTVEAMDTPDGGLVLTLDGGTRLVVAADEDFESWGYVGPDRERVVSMPGGELAIWD